MSLHHLTTALQCKRKMKCPRKTEFQNIFITLMKILCVDARQCIVLYLLCSTNAVVVDSHVLSARKAEKPGHMLDPIRNQVSRDERPMYCKEKIYCGTQEFSFEELRALRYMERKRIQQQEGEFLSVTFMWKYLILGSDLFPCLDL